jgi:hypothetical protein
MDGKHTPPPSHPNDQARAWDTRPVPDPTVLTTQALVASITSLREVLEAVIQGQKAVFESRLDGMDKAINLLQVTTDRQPAEVDRKIANLRVLHEEKFTSIQVQFAERDTRTEQSARDSKVAVDAALSAAKEAVGEQNKSSALAIAKSEAGTAKQIDQQALLIATATKALDEKIGDIKDRLTRIEGQSIGQTVAREDTKSLWAILIAAVGAVIAIGTVIAALAVRMP